MTEETVYLVDEQDNIIGTAPRSVMRAQKLRHRVVRIFLVNSRGELFIHQRAFGKDLYSEYFDTSIAGTVTTKTYEEEAYRELAEEVGITNTPIQPLFKFNSTETQSFCMVYLCVYDGPLTLQKEELVLGEFMSITMIKELLKKEKFHPSGVKAFEIYLNDLPRS